MKPWMWIVGGAAIVVLMSRRGTYFVSRGGVGTSLTPDFISDTQTSAIVKGTTPDVPTITSDQLFPESRGWRIM